MLQFGSYERNLRSYLRLANTRSYTRKFLLLVFIVLVVNYTSGGLFYDRNNVYSRGHRSQFFPRKLLPIKTVSDEIYGRAFDLLLIRFNNKNYFNIKT